MVVTVGDTDLTDFRSESLEAESEAALALLAWLEYDGGGSDTVDDAEDITRVGEEGRCGRVVEEFYSYDI